ncbi:MAG: PilZ domain-containing protein [Deltaproteobacteria bacterium]|nr:PilZ domain-containing protein [Deltaproteobacteria bacterium]
MSKEERKSPRIDFYQPLTIKGYEGVTRIKDFSLSGLFIEVEDPSRFLPGDDINLVLEFPYGNKPIVAKARVMRVTDEGIGVQFGELYPEERIELEDCFDLFKDTVPMSQSEE